MKGMLLRRGGAKGSQEPTINLTKQRLFELHVRCIIYILLSDKILPVNQKQERISECKASVISLMILSSQRLKPCGMK